MVEIETSAPSGQQEPVGSDIPVERIVEHTFDRPLEEQRALLHALAARVIPRLDDLGRREFIAQLRRVPDAHAKLDRRLGKLDRHLSSDELFGHIARQSIGAQKHILNMLATRVVHDLSGHERDTFLRSIDDELSHATEGTELPSLH